MSIWNLEFHDPILEKVSSDQEEDGTSDGYSFFMAPTSPVQVAFGD